MPPRNNQPGRPGPRPRSRERTANRGPGGTTAVVFPFDLFGGAGTAAGADLIAGELREILADNRREQTPTRARAYDGRVQVRRLTFDTLRAYQGWRQRARAAARRPLAAGEFLLWISGNHLGVLPVYEELGPESLVVQLDAHLDIHHFSDCTRELSHGNFLRHSTVPLPAVVNVGHRELLLRPADITAYYRRAHPAEDLAIAPRPVLRQLRQASRQAKRVFIDLDCDVFDPAFFPAAVQPVPFGLCPQQVLQVLDAVWSERVAGLAVSEFDPACDRSDHSLSMLMWLIEYLLLKRYEPASPS